MKKLFDAGILLAKHKICTLCGEQSKIWSKKMCKMCYMLTYPQKPIRRTPLKPKKNYKIPQQTGKQKLRLKKYMELRDIYLKEHPICEVCSAKQSEEIHHKAGKIGNNLFKDFLAVDRECHRWVEEHPKEAKEQNYSKTRL